VNGHGIRDLLEPPAIKVDGVLVPDGADLVVEALANIVYRFGKYFG